MFIYLYIFLMSLLIIWNKSLMEGRCPGSSCPVGEGGGRVVMKAVVVWDISMFAACRTICNHQTDITVCLTNARIRMLLLQ